MADLSELVVWLGVDGRTGALVGADGVGAVARATRRINCRSKAESQK